MAWWNFLDKIIKHGNETVEIFKENAEHKGQRKHEEEMADIGRDLASLQQFSTEFHERKQRTFWDSFVDGLNRLPRPILTISILSFFFLAPINPERFLIIAKSYEMMPTGYWALLSVIIGFYFGGRMQIKAQDMALKKDAVKAAKELVVMRKEFRKLEVEEEPVENKIYESAILQTGEEIKNNVVNTWLKSRANGVVNGARSVAS